MDAFALSLVHGMNQPDMPRGRRLAVAGTFGFFQMLMPLIGWICVKTTAEAFSLFSRLVPWIAMALLMLIGGKMLLEGFRGETGREAGNTVLSRSLVFQGIATSLDALSVGFTMAELSTGYALIQGLMIGVVTLCMCLTGIWAGGRAGLRLADRATVAGGLILILIGAEILLSHLLGAR